MPSRRFDGRRIREVRRAADLSQKELALGVGLKGHVPVAQWEAGRAFPPPEKLPAIARVLNLPLDKLFPRTGAPDLADLRCDAGFSQLQAAERLPVSRFQLGKAERGERRLDENALADMAALYGVDPETLGDAQARSFGEFAAVPTPPPGSFAAKLARCIAASPGSTPETVTDKMNAAVGHRILAAGQIEALLAGQPLENVVVDEAARALVVEGLAQVYGVPAAHFQDAGELERRVLDDIKLLAEQHQVALSARGGEGGVSPEMIRVLNDLLANEREK